ncbi:hypothetical protein THRCLA_01809 [Thraustotheca clavata]|uniref:Uncharacterized protein n=1 Tax=Thraustotheca clavata TaxID=74557 RepID=A0A1W0A758_9STRA|nr:hypothetical protein THRCLA_01809 [Thraustotheca clavata]
MRLICETRPPESVEIQSYKNFRLLSTYFQRWSKFLIEAHCLTPVQLRCLLRWISLSLPAVSAKLNEESFVSLAITKQLSKYDTDDHCKHKAEQVEDVCGLEIMACLYEMPVKCFDKC